MNGPDRLPAGSPSKIFCPFPAEIHPNGSAIESDLLAWAEQHRLVAGAGPKDRFTSARFGSCAALTYPRASDLSVPAKWVVWLFMLDDQFDENILSGGEEEARRIVSEICHTLEEWAADSPRKNGSASPFLTSLRDILEGIDDLSVPALWKLRFATHTRSYAMTYCSDAANSRNSGPLDLASYRSFRRNSGAVKTCIDLIEASNRIRLSKHHEGNRRIFDLQEAANDIICWTNDVFSLRKELMHGEMNNIVAVLRSEGCETWKQAMNRTLEMIEQRTHDLIAAKSDLLRPHATRGDLLNYISGIENWISGSLRWHQESSRYRPT
ncbi:hypothetical protein [Kitasatospora sp. NPDC085879]|uniref:terpene synthase family protein n=1 Tax=Kitasatospora sp. NPDC085879 TaxID=3154769 RepID=UPI00343F8BB8